MSTYTVQSGDYLWAIAEKCLGNGSRWSEIQALNNLPNDLIYPGQVLRLPANTNTNNGSSASTNYQVQNGDTLWTISEKFLGSGTRWNEIQTLNNLPNEAIYAGQTLKIPSNTAATGTNNPSSTQNTYKVQSGDSLWQISERLLGDGNRWKEIQALNNLPNEIIYPNQVLRLPTGSSVPSTGGSNSTYTVQQGDYLFQIAEKLLGTGTRWKEIQALNNLPNENIYPGQVLTIPPGPPTSNVPTQNYRVKSGDSLWKISENLLGDGNRWKEIQALNGLPNEIIYPEQLLKIPK